MPTYQKTGRAPGGQERAEVSRTAGPTMPQAVIISTIVSAVLALAVVLRLNGIPMAETLQILGGAGGIAVGVVLAVTPGGRGRMAAMARAALHAAR
ncbi:hypothetical protein [Streptomyces katrae]|uniref:hypothetical protein n=1 Tax=Streptomyces katrae TaxID=68223 RepID=UPI0004BFBEEC|nr:hypothetical protein [Streptomyces katrae]